MTSIHPKHAKDNKESTILLHTKAKESEEEEEDFDEFDFDQCEKRREEERTQLINKYVVTHERYRTPAPIVRRLGSTTSPIATSITTAIGMGPVTASSTATYTSATASSSTVFASTPIKPKRIDFSVSEDQALAGFVESKPNEDARTTYSPTTLIDDYRVRKQYIIFLKSLDQLPDAYKDTSILSTYFSSLKIKPEDDQMQEELIEEEEEDLTYLQTTVNPNTLLKTIITSDSTIITVQNIQKVYPNGHTENTQNVLPPETKRTVVEIDHTKSDDDTSLLLFSYRMAYAFCNAKIIHSQAAFNSTGSHILCVQSLKTRYLPAIRRMFMFEQKSFFTDNVWNLDVKQRIIENAKQAGLPQCTKIFYPITRPLAAYLLEVGPQGASWYPGLATFLSLYFIGVRRSALFMTTWADIVSYRRCKHPENKLPCEHVIIAIKGHKGLNKTFERHYSLISYEDKSVERLANSPNPVYWLNQTLLELTGGQVNIKQLMDEKNKTSGGSNKYREIARHFIFLNRVSNIYPDCDAHTIYKRCTSLSIVYNKHLRLLAEYAGLSAEIIDGITLHQSLRAGTTIEAHLIMEKEGHSTSDRNALMGWKQGSKVAHSNYDVNDTGHLSSIFINSRWNTMPTSLKVTVASTLISNQTNFDLKQLAFLIQGLCSLGNSRLTTLPFSKRLFFKENFDIVSDVLHYLQGGVQDQEDFEGSIIIATHKHYCLPSYPARDDYSSISKPRFLSLLSGMQREDMGAFVHKLLHSVSDVHLTFAKKVKKHFPSNTNIFPWKVQVIEPTIFNNNRKRELVKLSYEEADEQKMHSKRRVEMNLTKSDVSDKIDELNNASPVFLSSCCKQIYDQEVYRVYGDKVQLATKGYTRWDLLSFIIFGRIGLASQLNHFCKNRDLHKSLYEFSDINRYPIIVQRRYNDARGRFKNDVTSLPVDSKGNLQIDEEEIKTFITTNPFIHLLRGWCTICIVACDSILDRNINSQQVKDYIRNWRARVEKAKNHPLRLMMNNRVLLSPIVDARQEAGLTGSISVRRGSVFGNHAVDPTLSSSDSSVISATDTLLSSLSQQVVVGEQIVYHQTSAILFIPEEIRFHVDANHIQGNGIPNGNIPIAVHVPLYTGGFQYNHDTLTWSIPGMNNHGLVQAAGLGMGLPMEANVHHLHHNLYTEQWIVPIGGIDTVRTTNTTTGWCFACGWRIVNPNRPLDRVRFCPTIVPSSGSNTYKNYCHYSCSRSFLIDYNRMRFAAALCLYSPLRLRWAVSANMGHQGNRVKWCYYEFVDLFVGLKLCGQLDLQEKDWNLVLRHCLILRLTHKTTVQMTKKYQQMMVVCIDSNQPKYKRYFTNAFHDTVINFDPQNIPPPV